MTTNNLYLLATALRDIIHAAEVCGGDLTAPDDVMEVVVALKPQMPSDFVPDDIDAAFCTAVVKLTRMFYHHTLLHFTVQEGAWLEKIYNEAYLTHAEPQGRA